MRKIIIRGGKPLNGHIELQGSKNAVLPILFATIATGGISVIDNLPSIGDVYYALNILRDFGAKIDRGNNSVCIDTESLTYVRPNPEYVSKLRASTYLIGACLARFKKCEIMNFGGCNFGTRPIDFHINAAYSLGALADGDYLFLNNPVGCEIRLPLPSVGASINSILMALSCTGETVITNYAAEPHVFSLIKYLISCGADIRVSDTSIIIKKAPLHGGRVSVIPDMIEAGTYMLMSSMTGGRVSVKSEIFPMLASFISSICTGGVKCISENMEMYFTGEPTSAINIITEPYPGYPTDLQPQLAPVMAAFSGGIIEELVWEDRFNYLSSLEPFGVKYIRENNIAEVYPSKLKAATTHATDLRGGAACLLAALHTTGESIIYNADFVLRGYSDIQKNLTALGADIAIE